MAWHEAPKQRDHPDVAAYIEDLSPAQQGIYELVRGRLKEDPEVLEFIAWGVPCFWKQGPLVYLSAAKTHVTLGFFRGLEVGHGLVGTGKSPVAKHVWKIADPAPKQLDAWLSKALELDRD